MLSDYEYRKIYNDEWEADYKQKHPDRKRVVVWFKDEYEHKYEDDIYKTDNGFLVSTNNGLIEIDTFFPEDRTITTIFIPTQHVCYIEESGCRYFESKIPEKIQDVHWKKYQKWFEQEREKLKIKV